MHIPDGYLSLQTALPAAGIMVPFWKTALSKVKQAVGPKQMPLLALCAAYSFIIMMFNVPLGQSSVHAVGAVFIAILLGPWASCIAVSIALIIQALVFGDGGILAIGANCFNMAVAMPFVGYQVYKWIAGRGSNLMSTRGRVAVFAGAYAGINAAAFLTAVEFGIQPLLFKTAAGVPLYGYFPLSVAVPVMMFEHLVFAGPIEGILTVGALSYVGKWAPHLIPQNESSPNTDASTGIRSLKALLIGMGVLILLTPIGLIATGTAWGEWGADELKAQIGYVPQGFSKFSDWWQAVLPDYSMPWLQAGGMSSSVGYMASAVIGIALIFIILSITTKMLMKPEHDGSICDHER